MSGGSKLQLLSPLDVDAPLPPGIDPARIFGEIRFGEDCARSEAFPCLRVCSPTLVPANPWRAVWLSDHALVAGRHGQVVYRHDDDLMFGVISVDESAFVDTPSVSALQQAAEFAYREVFAALAHAAFPGLLRVWNYLPRINGIENGVERYRKFNIGRQDAFSACGRALTGRVPAASALGVRHGALEIGFFAVRRVPHAVENPRQVSAYHYPEVYGPRSPTFSRAAVSSSTVQDVLFISGTASIVGHQTLHQEDVAAQTRETLVNIDTVLAEAARVAPLLSPAREDLVCLGYVRDPADLETIRAEVRRVIVDEAQVCYVQADVCRSDLLVEIEASGGHPTQGIRT
ncbi:MAG: hypothetical protein RBT39_02455 [Azoarcus sp.]|jgi:enamine deaminase RidA (YjgF/YER057c/UK114 family)|nr:hypothetical protein [Azoarcus sp.]MDD2872060.1 hypothetical protein [Azoarcus sp.]MDX9836406.1 hypothetical protein [Azoarcus sp.]